MTRIWAAQSRKQGLIPGIGKTLFFFSHNVHTGSEAHSASCVIIAGDYGIMWPEHEVDDLSLFSTKVKNSWNYSSSPYVFMARYLIKYMD